MWEKGWRAEVWSELEGDWDILVIGGGITGAGVFRRAVAEGLKTLLVDGADFSFGTSSRSSKMVHGGFRYLRNRQFGVTRESVREREWLLREAHDLVTPLGFLMPYYQDRHVREQFALGVFIYDLLAPKWQHAHYSKSRTLREIPLLNSPGLSGSYLYYDAQMDDSRLVLNLIRQAVRAGGSALNYARAVTLLRDRNGKACGIALADQAEGLPDREIHARVVINAAGPWSDDMRVELGAAPKLRRIRGSHVVFPRSRLPLPAAVTLLHPKDRRAMFALPWEGVTLVGTTDVDHSDPIHMGEPYASEAEIEYILEAANATFPNLRLEQKDILSTFSGLRPVINTGKADPSKESRAHVVMQEEGLITVTGGKLTTFRIMAEQALQLAAPSLAGSPDFGKRKPYFETLPQAQSLQGFDGIHTHYLLGRYGLETPAFLQEVESEEAITINPLPNYWSELRYNARHGGVLHLDDLLLRRVRIGMLLPEGAVAVLPRVRQITQAELGWDDSRWQAEEARYLQLYNAFYAPSPTGQLQFNSGEITWSNQSSHPHGMKQSSRMEPIVLS
jgi:glycerol-3-phosphate dehydrogenase